MKAGVRGWCKGWRGRISRVSGALEARQCLLVMCVLIAGINTALSGEDHPGPEVRRAEERLRGDWVIDFDKTVSFHSEHYRTTPLMVDLSACSMHAIALKFNVDAVTFSIATPVCEHGEGRGTVQGGTSVFAYSVLYDGEKQTALKFAAERGDEVRVINWQTVDSFWLDEGSDTGVMRYFFKRK